MDSIPRLRIDASRSNDRLSPNDSTNGSNSNPYDFESNHLLQTPENFYPLKQNGQDPLDHKIYYEQERRSNDNERQYTDCGLKDQDSVYTVFRHSRKVSCINYYPPEAQTKKINYFGELMNSEDLLELQDKHRNSCRMGQSSRNTEDSISMDHKLNSHAINYNLGGYECANENRENMAGYLVQNNNNNSGMGLGGFGSGMNKKCSMFNQEQVQCMCEALQQKGDVEKLADFLRSLSNAGIDEDDEIVLR